MNVAQLVRQRRSQMLIHSFLYYVLDTPIVSDEAWQRWANELAFWNPYAPRLWFYDEEFADWNGSTGMHLPQDDWVHGVAGRILSIDRQRRADLAPHI